MTIELSYKKGQMLTQWMLMSAIRRQLPKLTEDIRGELKGIPVDYPHVKEDFDIKVTITINHQSINDL